MSEKFFDPFEHLKPEIYLDRLEWAKQKLALLKENFKYKLFFKDFKNIFLTLSIAREGI